MQASSSLFVSHRAKNGTQYLAFCVRKPGIRPDVALHVKKPAPGLSPRLKSPCAAACRSAKLCRPMLQVHGQALLLMNRK
jgi:hypothetical protein